MSKYVWRCSDAKVTHVVTGRIWFPTGCWRVDLGSSLPMCWRLLSVLATWTSYNMGILQYGNLLYQKGKQERERERTRMQDRSHIFIDLVTQ